MATLWMPFSGKAEGKFPRAKGWVNDFANVIDAGTTKRLTDLCVELDRKADAQIAVVTINSLEGTPINDYAYSLFNHWGIGHKGENRGVLILFAMSERKYRIEIGRGLEKLLPDQRVAGIGADMVPELKKQQYSKAALQSASEIAAIVANDRGVTLTTLLQGSPR